MTITPFGPRLIGETEKTLGALLRRALHDTGLTEPQWVTLKLAVSLDSSVDTDGLVAAVTDRAQFADAADLVGELTTRGILHDGRLTVAGRELTDRIQATITALTNPIWNGLPTDDVAATTRVLNEVLHRARFALG